MGFEERPYGMEKWLGWVWKVVGSGPRKGKEGGREQENLEWERKGRMSFPNGRGNAKRERKARMSFPNGRGNEKRERKDQMPGPGGVKEKRE